MRCLALILGSRSTDFGDERSQILIIKDRPAALIRFSSGCISEVICFDVAGVKRRGLTNKDRSRAAATYPGLNKPGPIASGYSF